MANNDDLYLASTNEFDSDDRDPALWAKCMSLCEGDEHKAKYKYIKERVSSMESEALSEIRDGEGFLNNLSRGNYGLAKTYWLYGVFLGSILGIPLNFITAKGGLILYFFVCSIYEISLLLGIWRSADKYLGFKVWAILAKLISLVGWVLLSATWVILVFN